MLETFFSFVLTMHRRKNSCDFRNFDCVFRMRKAWFWKEINQNILNILFKIRICYQKKPQKIWLQVLQLRLRFEDSMTDHRRLFSANNSDQWTFSFSKTKIPLVLWIISWKIMYIEFMFMRAIHFKEKIMDFIAFF